MNARDWALAELDTRNLPAWKSGALPRHLPDRAAPDDPRDRALAERIVIGVIKNQTLLMHLIERYSGRPLRQIDPLVVKILAIALYQLRFMDRVPASAAVNEAVAQTRNFGKTRAAGFVNAILRNATRAPDIPLPDEASDPEAYAAIVLSHPPELFRRLTRIMTVEDTLRFCRHDNAEPPTLLRLFRGVNIEQLRSEGVTITPHEQAGIAVVEPAKRAPLEEWSRRGLAQVQDATSARVVSHMDIQPGQRLLDRCCGLGTKTLQMRDELGEDGTIVAVDPSAARTAALRELIAARSLRNIELHQVSMLRQLPHLAHGSFDCILIDAPCSNSGVLARRPEARFAQDDRALRSLEKLQRDILDDTAPYLAPAGLLVYSTCSVWPEENEKQSEDFVQRSPDYSLIESRSILPSFESEPARYRDGGYVAVMRRA